MRDADTVAASTVACAAALPPSTIRRLAMLNTSKLPNNRKIIQARHTEDVDVALRAEYWVLI